MMRRLKEGQIPDTKGENQENESCVFL